MMSPALWLIVIPVLATPIVYLFRRNVIGALVATGVALFLAWLTLRLPLGLVITVLGRPVELNQLSQLTLTLLFATTAILFLIAAPARFFSKNREGKPNNTGRGQTFHTVGLVTLSVFAAASLSRHLGITAILVEVAVVFTVLIIQGRRIASTRAAQRFLILMTLALPLLLLAGWRIDQYQLSGGLQPTTYLQQTVLLVGLGFAFWLAVWPFHSWQSATAAETSPPAAGFVLTAFPIVVFSTLLNLLNASPWLITTSSLAWVMVLAGSISAGIAGVLAGVQRGFRSLMGYTSLFNLGLILAALGVGGNTDVFTVLAGLVIRSLALALISASLLALRHHTDDDGFAQVAGLAKRLPVATAGLMVGGFTLIGTPLTAGFPLQWQILQSISTVDSRWPILLVLAGLGATIGYLRGLRTLLTTNKEELSTEDALSLQEPRLLLVIISVLVIACVVLSIFPSLLLEPLQQLSAGLSIPIS